MPRLKENAYQEPRFDDVIEKVTDDETFVIGQVYEDRAATTIACKICGNKQFNVGLGSYYTAIRCPTCGWQFSIHQE